MEQPVPVQPWPAKVRVPFWRRQPRVPCALGENAGHLPAHDERDALHLSGRGIGHDQCIFWNAGGLPGCGVPQRLQRADKGLRGNAGDGSGVSETDRKGQCQDSHAVGRQCKCRIYGWDSMDQGQPQFYRNQCAAAAEWYGVCFSVL